MGSNACTQSENIARAVLGKEHREYSGTHLCLAKGEFEIRQQ